MDGRDTLPTNGAGYLEQIQQKMREYNCGKIASVNDVTTPWTVTGAGAHLQGFQRDGPWGGRGRQVC